LLIQDYNNLKKPKKTNEEQTESGWWRKIYQLWMTGALSTRVQVFNRESETAGAEFALSCYDADIKRIPRSLLRAEAKKRAGRYQAVKEDSQEWFLVQYLPDGRGDITERITANRIRPRPFQHHNPFQVWEDLTINGNTFRKGDGIEIQWKRQPSHPFGWWYGVVDHIFVDEKKKLEKWVIFIILHSWKVVMLYLYLY